MRQPWNHLNLKLEVSESKKVKPLTSTKNNANNNNVSIYFADIRLQLNEQLRCLDVRVESQVSLVQELQDFFRRRGELELDYCKSLDKLAKSLQIRHKEQKQK